MKRTALLGSILAVTLIVAAGAWFWPHSSLPPAGAAPPNIAERPTVSEPVAVDAEKAPLPATAAKPAAPPTPVTTSTATAKAPAPQTKLERLAQIRQTFTGLAAGEPKAALAAARQITDETEREAALMTLVTSWRRGELNPPQQRAAAIAAFGLEAGLGFEFAKDPDLAMVWANEMTEGQGRSALLANVARDLLSTDPLAAASFADRLQGSERRQVLDWLLGAWAQQNTDQALNWAQQISEPGERDAALHAIRQTAPVGIGAMLSVQDGLPVINGLMPNTPAALSGQINSGDRIVAIAQGDGQFVDVHNLPLRDVVEAIRGAPGSLVQLRLVSADAQPGSVPHTVMIIRDQIRYKQ